MTLNELKNYIDENVLIANSLKDNGKHKESIKKYDQLVKKTLQSSFKKEQILKNYLSIIYNRRAGVKECLGLIHEAIKDYNLSIEVDPTNCSSYNNRGGAKRTIYMHSKALLDYDKAILLNPIDNNYFSNRAIIKVELHMYEDALKDFDISLELNPICETYYSKGLCYYYMKKYFEAIECLKKALNINSTNCIYQSTLNVISSKLTKQKNNDNQTSKKLPIEDETIINYKKLMHEVRNRLLFIKSINLNNNQRTKDEIELIALNIRKILELISLSSLVANENILEKTRKELNKIWKAKEQLELIESKNPSFYINPLKHESSTNGVHRLVGIKKDKELESFFLTRKLFEKIYDKCGALMHATSPFKSIDLNYYETYIPYWLKLIETSLKCYTVNLNNGYAYLVEIDLNYEIRLSILSDNNYNVLNEKQ